MDVAQGAAGASAARRCLVQLPHELRDPLVRRVGVPLHPSNPSVRPNTPVRRGVAADPPRLRRAHPAARAILRRRGCNARADGRARRVLSVGRSVDGSAQRQAFYV
jgi:hypothetical protein